MARDIPKAVGRRRVEILIVKGKTSRRRDDPANRCGRAKSILDALVTLDLLVDDDDKWLEYIPVQEFRKPGLSKGYTQIRISESEQEFVLDGQIRGEEEAQMLLIERPAEAGFREAERGGGEA